MATVSIPDLLKAAERPLALFLDDALRSVREDYYRDIVVPFTGSVEYRGKSALVDARGAAKTSLLEFDLAFLTHLFEFAVYDERKQKDRFILYPDLCSRLPFRKDAVLSKIIAVRNLRNDWAHNKKMNYDEHHQMIDIAKLLDLFREEVQYVIKNSESIFSPETEAAVDEYVGRLTMEREGEKNSSGWTIHNPKVWAISAAAILTMIVATWIIGLATTDSGGANASNRPTSLHILATMPTPTSPKSGLEASLNTVINSAKCSRVIVYSQDRLEGHVISVGDDQDAVSLTLSYLSSVERLESPLNVGQLFSRVVSGVVADNHDGMNSKVMILGSIGQLTADEQVKYGADSTLIIPFGTTRILKGMPESSVFVAYLSKPTAWDEAIVDALKGAKVDVVVFGEVR